MTLSIHELFLALGDVVTGLMIVIPLAMAAGAVFLGWRSRQAALARKVVPGAPRERAEDALSAGITVAIVPFLFALLVIWARFF